MKKSSLFLHIFFTVAAAVNIFASYGENLEEFSVSEDELQETAAGTVVGRKTVSVQVDSGAAPSWSDDVEDYFIDSNDIADVWNVKANNPLESTDESLAKRVFSVKNISVSGAVVPNIVMPSVNFPDVNIRFNTSAYPAVYRTVYRGRPIYIRRPHGLHPVRPQLRHGPLRHGPLRPHVKHPPQLRPAKPVISGGKVPPPKISPSKVRVPKARPPKRKP